MNDLFPTAEVGWGKGWGMGGARGGNRGGTGLLYFCFATESHIVHVVLSKDGLELLILLPPHPQCCDYRCAPSCLALYSVWDGTQAVTLPTELYIPNPRWS